MTTYEKLIFNKRFHFIPYWILIGAFLFLQQEIVVRISGETDFMALRFLISFYVSIVAIFIISLANIFPKVINELADLIDFPAENIDRWIDSNVIQMGTFNTLSLKLFSVILIVLFISTVLVLGVPYKSLFSNINFLLSLIPFLLTSAHAVFGAYKLLLLLTNLVRYPIKPAFFLSRHPGVTLLSVFYSRTTMLALVIVIWLALCVWQNPYGFTPLLLDWLIFVSFLPLSLFLWTFFQTHTLMMRIKLECILIVNNHVQDRLKLALKDVSKKYTEELLNLMSIQDMVEKMDEWPIAYQGIAAFFATILFPVANIALGLLGVFDFS